MCSTYDGQELLDVLDNSLGLCPKYFPPGQECTLPLNPGAYGSLVGGDLYIVLPEIANDLSKYIYQKMSLDGLGMKKYPLTFSCPSAAKYNLYFDVVYPEKNLR